MPDGDRFNLLNTELRKMNADIIDEHYYRKPEWFLQNVSRYDNYPRNGSKVFAGDLNLIENQRFIQKIKL